MAATALRPRKAGARSRVVAVSGGGLSDEHFIGELVTFTMKDDSKSGAKVVRSWANNGLDVDDLPVQRHPVHFFQSACASVRRRRRVQDGYEVTADEVDNNGTCAYQITLKVWDLANRTIEHEKAMRVIFDKRTATISVDELDRYDRSMRELEQEIREHFDVNLSGSTIPGQKIRNAVRDQLLRIGAQNLRRRAGGLYFVPKEYRANGHMAPTKPILDGLAGVLRDLYKDDADFYTIPLVNDEGQREMVRKHFVINANEKAEELALKALNRVRSGKGERGVRSDLVTNLWNERRKLMGAVEQFEELVQVEQGDLARNLKLLDKALGKLQELADAPE